MNFTSRLAVAKKISIKALDFEKLPRKFSGTHYIGNAFLNITRSSSNRGGKDNLTSSLTKNKGKILFAKPLTSRSRNENAVKLNVIPKTTATIINITQGQKMHNSHQMNNKQQKPLNKLFSHSLYVSYNNSSSNYKNFNSNAMHNMGNNQKSVNGLNKMDSKSNSRNQSKNSNNNLINNSTFSSNFVNSKDSSNITNSTIEKIKKFTNMGINNKISNKNKNNINENMSLTKSTLSSHNNNASGYNYNTSNYNNLNINSYNTKEYNKNTYKHFSNGNLSSLSHKKFGIKVKKKVIKSTGG